MSANDEAVARSLLALAEAGIPTDIQELLLRGNPMKGVAPGALHKALAAYTLGSAGGDDVYMPLTEEQKAGIRARAEAATPEKCAGGQRAEVLLTWAEQRLLDYAREDIPTLLSAVASAERRAEEAEKELQVAMKRLSNPNAVYINMVRSVIAKPSVSQLEHVYQGELTTERDTLRARVAELEGALGTAIRHIEHMAQWIGDQKAGYSFEALGEDRSDIYVLEPAKTAREDLVWEIKYEDRPSEFCLENPGISAGEGTGILSVRSVPISEMRAALTKKEPSDGQG